MSWKRLFCPLVCVFALALAAGAWSDTAVEFIHLTDIHVVELAGVEPRAAATRKHFGPSSNALVAFFAEAGRKHRPSFFLITGDLIDAYSLAGAGGQPVYGQVEAFHRVAAGSPAPLYLTLGNHDIHHYGINGAGKPDEDQSVAGEARAAWIVSEPCFRKGTYYSFERRTGGATYVFLMLDNAYNAGEIAPEQVQWLRRQAQLPGGRVLILAMHIPLADDATSRAIKSAVAPARVALVLAGHQHKDGIEEIPLGTGTAVQVRTSAFGYGASHWRKIRLLGDRIEISATGQTDRIEKTFPVQAAAPEEGDSNK